MIIRYARNGEVLFTSNASLALLGHPPQALIGRKTSEFVHPDDIAALRAHKLALHLHPPEEGAEAEPIEFRLKRADGEWVWVEGRPRIIFDQERGSSVETLDELRDISHRKAPAAQTTADVGAPWRSTAAALADCRRPQEGSPVLALETVHLQSVLEDAVGVAIVQARTKAIDLTLACETPLPSAVVLDPARIRELLLTLLGNALRFTKEGGVRLTARYDATRRRLHCEVLDTSLGVPVDEIETVLKGSNAETDGRTERVDAVHRDIASAVNLIAALDGEMGVVSLNGLGACFWFEIPCPLVTGAAEQTLAGFNLEGLRVLVADDNAAQRDLIRLMLSPFGVDVTEASSSHEVLAATAAAPFDVILVDLRPSGLDGAAAARAIRRSGGPNQAVPFIAFGDAGGGAYERPEGEAPFAGLVAKPVTLEALISKIAAVTSPPPPFALDAAA